MLFITSVEVLEDVKNVQVLYILIKMAMFLNP